MRNQLAVGACVVLAVLGGAIPVMCTPVGTGGDRRRSRHGLQPRDVGDPAAARPACWPPTTASAKRVAMTPGPPGLGTVSLCWCRRAPP